MEAGTSSSRIRDVPGPCLGFLSNSQSRPRVCSAYSCSCPPHRHSRSGTWMRRSPLSAASCATTGDRRARASTSATPCWPPTSPRSPTTLGFYDTKGNGICAFNDAEVLLARCTLIGNRGNGGSISRGAGDFRPGRLAHIEDNLAWTGARVCGDPTDPGRLTLVDCVITGNPVERRSMHSSSTEAPTPGSSSGFRTRSSFPSARRRLAWLFDAIQVGLGPQNQRISNHRWRCHAAVIELVDR